VLGQSTGLVATLSAGASVAIVERFQAEETLSWMNGTRTTILLGVPTMCIALCEAARSAGQLPPVRIAHVGGAPIPVEVARDFERTFGGEVYEGYGLTELSGIATTFVAGQTRKPGSVGMALGKTEMRIVAFDDRVLPANEPGEVQFRGPSVIPGYWHDEEATAEALSEDGWLSTGDVGYVDEEGYLFLVDRKKDVIIRGGYNVYPREVEEVLYGHPDVLEAAVVGVPHPTLGEEVAALVVGRPGASPDPEMLRAYARERVAAYKYPRHVVIVDSLPKGPTGKILKREIDAEALVAGG
jgi:long-chain acyl-CoA synthetase